MTDFDALYVALLAWIHAGLALAGEPTAATVKVVADDAESGGTRPPVPYLTCKIIEWDTPLGLTASIVHGLGGRVISRNRQGALSLQGFGPQTRPWLEALALVLDDPSIIDLLLASGLVLTAESGITDVSALMGTAFEPRYARDIRVDYTATLSPIPFAEAVTAIVGVTLERYDAHLDPLTTTLTVSI